MQKFYVTLCRYILEGFTFWKRLHDIETFWQISLLWTSGTFCQSTVWQCLGWHGNAACFLVNLALSVRKVVSLGFDRDFKIVSVSDYFWWGPFDIFLLQPSFSLAPHSTSWPAPFCITKSLKLEQNLVRWGPFDVKVSHGNQSWSIQSPVDSYLCFLLLWIPAGN